MVEVVGFQVAKEKSYLKKFMRFSGAKVYVQLLPVLSIAYILFWVWDTLTIFVKDMSVLVHSNKFQLLTAKSLLNWVYARQHWKIHKQGRPRLRFILAILGFATTIP